MLNEGIAVEPSAAADDPGLPLDHEGGFFGVMARHPIPFLVVIPAVFAALIGVGWTQEDKVEQNVANLWIPTGTQYYQDKLYQAKFTPTGTIEGRNRNTIFAAMAVGRDGGNIFNEPRLNEISDRMAVLENTTVEYKGQTFTWDDM
uniref:Uncharacterized protein n=1 Tax=Odontella aurita TaxID=265563 RepID=A0A7S4HIN4_9STRA|mmetsp:Transcript_10606/g.31314  ORF Transcript_10606/g.31314 Transcript_10606/m.31314 type:complete len:146 (+) Transcript_10606:384-821(+)